MPGVTQKSHSRDAKPGRRFEVNISLQLYIWGIIAHVAAAQKKKPFISSALFICCYVADTLKTLSNLMGILVQYVHSLSFRETRGVERFKKLFFFFFFYVRTCAQEHIKFKGRFLSWGKCVCAPACSRISEFSGENPTLLQWLTPTLDLLFQGHPWGSTDLHTAAFDDVCICRSCNDYSTSR